MTLPPCAAWRKKSRAARELDEISGAPQQFAAIAGHLRQTSSNLLELERLAASTRRSRAGS